MPFLAPALPYLGLGMSALGGMFGDQQSGSQSGSMNQTTMPVLPAQYQPLQDQIKNLIMQRLSQGTDLGGYTSGGLSQINRNAALAKTAANNDLVSRGLATSPVAGVVNSNLDLGRVGAATQFENSIPLLQRQLQGQDVGMAGDFLNSVTGRNTTGTSTGTYTGSSGGGLGGAFTNAAGMLGYLQGKGAFGNGGFTGKRYTPADLGY